MGCRNLWTSSNSTDSMWTCYKRAVLCMWICNLCIVLPQMQPFKYILSLLWNVSHFNDVINILIKCKHASLLHLYMFFWILFPDYESLRIGGMIFAVILFLMGIFLIVGECQTLYCSQKELYLCIVIAIKCIEYFCRYSSKNVSTRADKQISVTEGRLVAGQHVFHNL